MTLYITGLLFGFLMGFAYVVISDENSSDSDSTMELEMYDEEMRGYFGELNLSKQYFEGDITLTEEQSDLLQKRWKDYPTQSENTTRGLSFRKLWFNNTVPYTLTRGLRMASLINIRSAMQEWQNSICITFKERSLEEDYIEFAYEGGCSSNIGRIGGRQVISVGSIGTEFSDRSCMTPTPYGSNVTITCTKGNILHEIGHALGYYHEHNRPDRDEYLTVVWKNVIPGCKVHFQKEGFTTIDSRDMPYDYNSVMHYGSFFFSQERGLRTLLAKMKGVRIGQREKLSALDAQRGRLLYQCTLMALDDSNELTDAEQNLTV